MAGMEHYIRLTDILMCYWEKLKGDQVLPLETQIDPDELQNIWDDCFLVQITPSGKYRYDYMGKSLIEAYGEGSHSEEAELLICPTTHRAVEHFEQVVKKKTPCSDEGEFCNSDGLLIKYRQLLLPFAKEGDEVKYIFGGMKWRTD